MDPLESYIDQFCQRHPAAVMPVSRFIEAFHAHLDADLRPAWKRSRIVAWLVQHGYSVGTIDNVFHIGGVASGSWVSDGGRLVLSA
jgi:hypothetical protein